MSEWFFEHFKVIDLISNYFVVTSYR